MGKIITISGRSGVGKSSIAYALESDHPYSEIIKSYTTRSPRESDRNDYLYLSKSQFEERHSEFVYAVKIHDNYYGTLNEDIQNAICSDKFYTLVVSIETAIDMCKSYPLNTVGIFLTADSDVVRSRLNGRGDHPHQIEARIKQCETWETSIRRAVKEGTSIHLIDATREFSETLREVRNTLKMA